MVKKKIFEETYPTNEKYQRFDQRNTSFQQKRRSTGSLLDYNTDEYKADKIRKNVPGFGVVDYAFKQAAGMYEGMPGGDDGMSEGYYSWTPLGVGSLPKGVPKWSGTPEKAAKIITKAAKYFGAVGVGFCPLDERWIYSHTNDGKEIVIEEAEASYINDKKAVIPKSHKWVIAMVVPMEHKENSYAPTAIEVTSNMGYSRMHILSGYVAEFIRALGYSAIPMGNDTALSVPIALQAGLGHMGRHGRLITWDHGPLVRICKIFTDLPLPQSPPAPSGIIEYCEVCGRCAKKCPSESITPGPRTWEGPNSSNNNGSYKWYNDEDKCLRYWNEVGSGCSICFRVCAFTKEKAPLHDLVKWILRRTSLFNRPFVVMDELMGYGNMPDPRKYWDEP